MGLGKSRDWDPAATEDAKDTIRDQVPEADVVVVWDSMEGTDSKTGEPFLAQFPVLMVEVEGKLFIKGWPCSSKAADGKGRWMAWGKIFDASLTGLAGVVRRLRDGNPDVEDAEWSACTMDRHGVCSREITWLENHNGKNVPVERDGASHYDWCGSQGPRPSMHGPSRDESEPEPAVSRGEFDDDIPF